MRLRSKLFSVFSPSFPTPSTPSPSPAHLPLYLPLISSHALVQNSRSLILALYAKHGQRSNFMEVTSIDPLIFATGGAASWQASTSPRPQRWWR